jgi:hypothetical protein
MTNLTRPYHQDATQRERKEVLRNDTLQFRTAADLGLENTGRYAKPFTVTGTEPSAQYPRLPENSWVNDPVPPEAPLGHAIDEQEPCGEIGEIRASLDDTSATNVVDTSCADPSPTGEAPLVTVCPKVEPPVIPNPKRRPLR